MVSIPRFLNKDLHVTLKLERVIVLIILFLILKIQYKSHHLNSILGQWIEVRYSFFVPDFSELTCHEAESPSSSVLCYPVHKIYFSVSHYFLARDGSVRGVRAWLTMYSEAGIESAVYKT